MTIGMLIEMLTGKKVCIGKINKIPVNKVFCLDSKTESERTLIEECYENNGEIEHSDFKDDQDATPFNEEFSLSRICKELSKYGYGKFGDEIMINGMTGEIMNCMIYTGVCYYQRLRHMVIDKLHARSRGGRNLLTRQPLENLALFALLFLRKYKIREWRIKPLLVRNIAGKTSKFRETLEAFQYQPFSARKLGFRGKLESGYNLE